MTCYDHRGNHTCVFYSLTAKLIRGRQKKQKSQAKTMSWILKMPKITKIISVTSVKMLLKVKILIIWETIVPQQHLLATFLSFLPFRVACVSCFKLF